MAAVLADLGQNFALLSEGRSITVNHDAGCAAGLIVERDELRLRQIVGNLVRNAILHSQGSQVEIAAAGCKQIDDKLSLTIAVSDNGKGIAPALQPHLFEAFRRKNIGVFSQAEGSGLGMYIVKTLVDRMGGAIRLAYSGQTGTQFQVHLTLPMAKSDTNAAPVLPKVPRETRVLLVEDHPLLADLTVARLRTMFDSVTLALPAESARAVVARDKPDLVITDQNLPGMSGSDLAACLRGDGYRGSIVALMGEEMTDALEHSFAVMGGAKVLKKPLVMNELLFALAS